MPLPPGLQRIVDAKKPQGLSGAELFDRLMHVDGRLVAAGFPAMSSWWSGLLREFYESGRRRLVVRVGRRGGKSSTISRVATTETLYGTWVIPPGDLGIWPIVSTTRPEASKRLITIKAVLDALRIKYGPIGEGIHGCRIEGTRLAFQVFAASIAGVSGFTGIGSLCDEMPKWKDKDTGVNPSKEVLKSLGPTMANQVNAHEFWVGSPWSTLDSHHEAYQQGDTDEQMVAYAPTWVANPTISEARTHEMEPDESSWRREYLAEPMGSSDVNFFDHRMIDAAINKSLALPLPPVPGVTITGGGDLGFVSDCAVLAFAHRIGPWKVEESRYRTAELFELKPQPEAPLMPSHVMAKFVERLKWHTCGWMMGDGHYKLTALEHLIAAGLKFHDAPEGQAGKAEVYVRARVVLNGLRWELPNDPRFIKQMKEVMSKPTAAGGLTIWSPKKPGGGHGDLVSAIVLALWQKTGRDIHSPPPPIGSDLAIEAEEKRMERQIREQMQQRRAPIWDRRQR